MSRSLIGAKSLSVDPAAEAMHQQALNVALHGNYDQALGMFDDVLDMVEALPAGLDSSVQASRVLRDKGFTRLRRAIRDNNEQDLGSADESLRAAAELTFKELSRLPGGSNAEDPLIISKKKRSELAAEHGATQSLIGRLATAKLVLFGGAADEAKLIYEAAHANLIQGNNVYYLVSNAICFARNEKINNHRAGVRLGVRAAVAVLAIKGLSDPRNMAAAAKTFVSRSLDLRSQKQAVESVKTKP